MSSSIQSDHAQAEGMTNEDVSAGSTPVIDYEGSQYATDFWINQGREYEDSIERLVLQELVPPSGRRIVEIGAGFGRLANLYQGYDQIILFDYSRSLLQEAVKRWGDDDRFVFVAGNIYELPFASGVIDTLVMVRVMHHLANVSEALAQLNRVIHGDSTAILEYANKRNLKSILRWASGRQSWSPFELEPYEFVELNFDFHPVWMQKQLRESGFTIQQCLAVSHFRLAQLKQLLSAKILARIDKLISRPGGWYPLSPSVFIQTGVSHQGARKRAQGSLSDFASLFRCPSCGSEEVALEKQLIQCTQCSGIYHQKGKIWDFKEKL